MPCNLVAVQKATVSQVAIEKVVERPELLDRALADLGIKAQVSSRYGRLIVITPQVQVAIDPDGKLWIYPNRTPLSKEQQEQINTLISRALRLAATRYAQAEFVLAAKRAGLRISGASPVPGGRKIILEV